MVVDSPLLKAPTGIQGLDEITAGGLPKGRSTLISGSAGAGKTLLSMEFLVRGAREFDEPGLFVSFEETASQLVQNVASLGFNLSQLVEEGKIALDHIQFERAEIEEAGEFDLEGLFVRLGFAIDRIGAKRVVLDTLEALFSAFGNEAILRSEMRRLFRWLGEKGVTSIITAERGKGTLSRHGIEEYVSDCVIELDARVANGIATRRIRIVKYRGSTHGTNEYPFLIGADGLSILPVTSLTLNHEVSQERVSMGIEELDVMLGGKGVYRGSSVLVSGTAGSGKSSIAAHFTNASCRRAERVLYFAFEESPKQIIRNMRSIGIDLGPWVEHGLLRIMAARPTMYGLEEHLTAMLREVHQFGPAAIIFDPLSNMNMSGTFHETRAMLMRFIDYLKSKCITALFTSLTQDEVGGPRDSTDESVSSLMDTWLSLRMVESSGERNRVLYLLKSRGTAHSNQMREFVLTSHGAKLVPVYLGQAGVLTGAARQSQEARDRAESLASKQQLQRTSQELHHRRRAFENRLEALRAEFAAEEEQLQLTLEQQKFSEKAQLEESSAMEQRRTNSGSQSKSLGSTGESS